MANVILICVIALILSGAITYIVKAKKAGVKCIGCPAGGTCSGSCAGSCAGSCSGNCSGNSSDGRF